MRVLSGFRGFRVRGVVRTLRVLERLGVMRLFWMWGVRGRLGAVRVKAVFPVRKAVFPVRGSAWCGGLIRIR